MKNFYYDDAPLIFDERFKRKESYYSLRDAIATMSIGGKVGGDVLLDNDEYKDGKNWGHEWMPQKVIPVDVNEQPEAGDSRPDWLQN